MRPSDASLRRDVYRVIAHILQGDIDNGADWIREEQDGTPSSKSIALRREAIVRMMRYEFYRKGLSA